MKRITLRLDESKEHLLAVRGDIWIIIQNERMKLNAKQLQYESEMVKFRVFAADLIFIFYKKKIHIKFMSI